MTSASVRVLDYKDQWITCRALLDSCSTANFITEKLADKLKLPQRKCMLPVGTLSSIPTFTKHIVDLKFGSLNSNFEKGVSCLTVLKIAEFVPSEAIPRESLSIPPNLVLADPEFHKPAEIDMLLGSGPTLSLFSIGQIKLINHGVDLYMQKTRLGWVIGGSVSSPQPRKSISCNLSNLEKLLTRFWEVEELAEVPNSSLVEDCPMERHFRQTTRREPDGRFVVALPFKVDSTTLGESRSRAIIMLNSLLKRFERDTQLETQYCAAMQQYLDKGYMSIVDNEDLNDGYYMPHHAVIKNSSLTTKTRIVFNCSAPTSTGVSLNELLHKGPTIQNSTFIIHVRFRTFPIVVMGDIEKMYLQVKVREQDRKFQRAMWRHNGKIVTLQSNTLTFGETPAPYLAIRCLQELAQEHKSEFPNGARALEKDTYVDNVATGANSVQEAIDIRTQISEILNCGKFHICQWASNHPEALSGLKQEEINPELHLHADDTVNLLGVRYEAKRDRYIYSTRKIKRTNKVTKRIILSIIARIYDPLGLLGPVIMYAKIILQLLWKENLNWDESVPPYIHTKWLKFCNQLFLINDFAFERIVLIPNYVEIDIIGFSDACKDGYGANLYIRSRRGNKVMVRLLCSKSRVAPIKKLTLPRLELSGAKLLVTLLNEVVVRLGVDINNTYLWTDSMVVLHWIHTPPSALKTFVANRVAFICTTTEPAQWRHVRSKFNAADCLSRGELPRKFLKNSIWREGPNWLKLDKSQWPEGGIKPQADLPELKPHTTLVSTTNKHTLFEKYSSYQKLLRICSLLYRMRVIHKQGIRYDGKISLREMWRTEIKILKVLQSIAFSKEIRQLKNNTELKKCRLQQLSPFLDRNGLLRVGGRLNNSYYAFNKCHPILIPSYNHVTDLIIRQYHFLHHHCGIQTTLSMMRNKYWLLDGRNQIRRVIRNCVVCFRANPMLATYKMGNLPKLRTDRARVFQNVGVDFCGPFLVRESRARKSPRIKVYVAVFICMVVKAIHLEVVYDLSSEAFIAALSNFVSRRGYPKTISSDNATNFKGANNELRELYDLFQDETHKLAISSFCNQRNITWVFIPPRAPNFGGLWESAVKMFKHHLKRAAKDSFLLKDQFTSLVIGIEAILNSRPITHLSDDPNDLQALTPGHFLIGESLTCLPEPNLLTLPTNRLSLWQHVTKIKQDFWQQWYKEYINDLNCRQKWKVESKNLEVGTLVLLKDQDLPTMQWAMARVIAVHPGTDGIVRAVTVRTNKSEYRRSVQHLAPLPIDDPEENLPQRGEYVVWKCTAHRHSYQ